MRYLVFSPDVSLRRLEQPYLYDRSSDELYELSEEASEFLESAGGPPPLPPRVQTPILPGTLPKKGWRRWLTLLAARSAIQASYSLRRTTC